VLNRPIEYFPDSEGYLQFNIIRSACYPLFLAFIKGVFGAHFEFALICCQIVFGLLSIYFMIHTLNRLLNINFWWLVLLTIILLIPYFYNHHVANRILSEGLAYPLYLLVVTHFSIALITYNKKNLIYVLLFLLFLIQTRWQFMFFIPIGLLILTWISYRTKMFKASIWLFALFLIYPLIMSTLDKSFHKIAHGYYLNTPWRGVLTITPAIYVADKLDYKIFEDENEKAFFKIVFDKLQQRKLTIHQLDSTTQDEYYYYFVNFNNIAIETVLDEGKLFVSKQLSENEKYIAVNRLTKKMTYPLIFDNFIAWSKLYIQNFIHAFGNSRYCLLYFMLLFFGLYGLLKYETPSFKLVALLSLLTIANNAVVAIGVHTIKRLTFYNDWVLFIILFVLLNALFKLSKAHAN